MKKMKLSMLATLFIDATLLCVTSCPPVTRPIDCFGEKMAREESYKLTVSFLSDKLEPITMVAYQQGDTTYYPANATLGYEAHYSKNIGGYWVEYTRSSHGKWIKDICESEDIFDFEKNDIFNQKSYKKIAGKKNMYRQKKNVIFDHFENVRISFVESNCLIECKIMPNTVAIDAEIVISKVGEISFDLPEVK